MACGTNRLDSASFIDPNINVGRNCEPGVNYPSCLDGIDICLCDIPPNAPPPADSAQCVNDIIKRPWPPPPPANPGCNPFSVSVTSRQDPSVPPGQNIRLDGKVSYIGNDPCLPELNLDLRVNPDFRAGGAAPIARGWGITRAGIPENLSRIRVFPNQIGGDDCTLFDTPQDFLANAVGAEGFSPLPDLNCNTPFGNCDHPDPAVRRNYLRYRQAWDNKIAKWGLIGPKLAKVVSAEPIHDAVFVVGGRQIQYAWKYTVEVIGWRSVEDLFELLALDDCGFSGDNLPKDDYVPGGLNSANVPNLNGVGAGRYEFVRNIHETLTVSNGQTTFGYGAQVISSDCPQIPLPISKDSHILIYGIVPSAYNFTPDTDLDSITAEQCKCEIRWFFVGQNYLKLETSETTPGLNFSILPSRKLTSAGMFFGIDTNENRV
jgi:hypothetical protein